MDIVPIKTHRDYRRALKEIEGLMAAKRNTPAGDRLDVLVTLVRRGNANIIQSTYRIQWRLFDITWTRTGFNRAISFLSSAVSIASMRCLIESAH